MARIKVIDDWSTYELETTNDCFLLGFHNLIKKIQKEKAQSSSDSTENSDNGKDDFEKKERSLEISIELEAFTFSIKTCDQYVYDFFSDNPIYLILEETGKIAFTAKEEKEVINQEKSSSAHDPMMNASFRRNLTLLEMVELSNMNKWNQCVYFNNLKPCSENKD